MWTTQCPATQDALTCPFCGLGCDDLCLTTVPDGRPVLANACAMARDRFAEVFAADPGTAQIGGRPASLDEAIEACAAFLGAARAPLFGGLVTDVAGMRATLELADHRGALLDHMGGEALFRNLLVLQDGGWMTSTLTEVRNRADLILLLGTQCTQRFPRLVERVLLPPQALFSPSDQRSLVLLGPWDQEPPPADLRAANPDILAAPRHHLAGICGVLRALIAGRPVRPGVIPGIADARLKELAERLRNARYAVLVWSAAELDFPHAELTVQALVELVRDLNATTRAAALPLAGTLGDLTANQVCTWQTGYPLRTSLAQDGPRYDPHLHQQRAVLARDECDLLLWIASLPGSAAPPATHHPTLVLGHPGIAPERTPEVLIPVGLPGIDHPGHWFRTDAVCPLPLGRIRDQRLPSVAQVIGRLHQRLQQTP